MVILRLPNLPIIKPVTGKAIKLPMGIANSTEPSAASLSFRKTFTSGMRDAQEAKLKPQRKNKVLVAARAIRPIVCVRDNIFQNNYSNVVSMCFQELTR